MSHRFLIIIHIVFLVLHPLNEVQASNGEAVSIEDFIGIWKGEGKIIVTWCEQKQLAFELQIDSDGNVSGKIGDAHIRHGKIRLNNIFYRWLGNKKYIIDTKLSNCLIKKEKIKRDSIRIFLDFQKPFLIGGFHTSGSKFGGKEKMIVSGNSVKLVKIMK
jgi:hypothetical protein